MHHSQRVLLLCLVITTSAAKAQLGGDRSFQVLNLPSSARIAALGGSHAAVVDNDINLGIFNPALLNATMGKQVALSYQPWFADVNVGYASYAHSFDSLGITAAGTLQYLDYGTFQRRDETGADLGTFLAGEYLFQVGGSKALDSIFTAGVNLKYVQSALDTYTGSAVAADIGIVMHKRALGLTVSAMLRNIGYQLTSYTSTREKLPVQAQLAATYKFAHAPFRLGLTLQDMQQWDLTYEDPTRLSTIDPLTGEIVEEKVTTVDKALLHVIGSAEVLMGASIRLRFGYNYRVRQELKINEKPGLAGLSFGLGLRISKLHVSYGYAHYNQAAAGNTLTLALRFADLKRQAG
jgi:hypothetical protein